MPKQTQGFKPTQGASYLKLKNVQSVRNSLPQARAHPLLIQYQSDLKTYMQVVLYRLSRLYL